MTPKEQWNHANTMRSVIANNKRHGLNLPSIVYVGMGDDYSIVSCVKNHIIVALDDPSNNSVFWDLCIHHAGIFSDY